MEPRLAQCLLLLAGIGPSCTFGFSSLDGAFSNDFTDIFDGEGNLPLLETKSGVGAITGDGFSISTPLPSDDNLKAQDALLAGRMYSQNRRGATDNDLPQFNNNDQSLRYGRKTAVDSDHYKKKGDSLPRVRRTPSKESEASHPLLVQGVDTTQVLRSTLVTWKSINSSVFGTPVCGRIVAFRVYRQSIYFDDVSQLRAAMVGEVRIPRSHAGLVHRYTHWIEENPPTISCLYYAVTVVCADDNGNEVEYKKVRPTQPMVIVAEHVESGDVITLHAPSEGGRPGHPAMAQSPQTKNLLVVYDIDTYDDQLETDNKPDSVVAILLSPSGEELWGRHITHYTVKGERGQPAVVYHDGKRAFFVAYELQTQLYNNNRKIVAGCFVYENGSFTHSYVAARMFAGDLELFDLVYNPAIWGVSFALQVWDSISNNYHSHIVYDKNGGESLTSAGLTANATSPRLAFDKKHNEVYVVVEIDKQVGQQLSQSRCSGIAGYPDNDEEERGKAAVAVLKLDGRQVTRNIGKAVAFGFVAWRNNGLTAFYDASRDAVAFSYTSTVSIENQLRHHLWMRYFRNAEGNLAGGSCQFQTWSVKNVSAQIRHQAAVLSPVNKASFIVYEARTPSGQWRLGTLSQSKDLNRWRSDAALFPATIYDETCKCFFVCWQDSCGGIVRCQHYSVLQHGHCYGATEAKCLARINRRPSCESWCGSRNASALSYCTVCDPPARQPISSGTSDISRARKAKKNVNPPENTERIYMRCPRCGCRCPNVSCRKTYIVGGAKVEPHCWPWMVYLKDVTSPESDEASKSPFCGGTLINPRFVLTAAHCVWQKEASKIAVYAGKSKCWQKLPEDCEQRQIGKKVVIHEDYAHTTIVNDIAIIKLKKAFHLNQQVRTVCLPDDDCSVASNSSVYVVGCGAKRNSSLKGTKYIRQIVEPIISNEACRRAYPNSDGLTIINENMFCAGSGLGESDTCDGDSGGGAFVYEQSSCRFVQVGLISWGDQICGKQGKYTVFTKVYNYLKWIKNIVNHPCN